MAKHTPHAVIHRCMVSDSNKNKHSLFLSIHVPLVNVAVSTQRPRQTLISALNGLLRALRAQYTETHVRVHACAGAVCVCVWVFLLHRLHDFLGNNWFYQR